MIIAAKEVRALYRFNSERSVGVMLQGNVQGRESSIEAFEIDFPIGLFAKGAPLHGKTVDVICFPLFGDQLTNKYVVAKWGNQNDSIKANIMAHLISGMSSGGLETIPWKEEFDNEPSKDNSLKEKLENLYSSKSGKGLITPLDYSKNLLNEGEVDLGNPNEEDDEDPEEEEDEDF